MWKRAQNQWRFDCDDWRKIDLAVWLKFNDSGKSTSECVMHAWLTYKYGDKRKTIGEKRKRKEKREEE